MHQRLLAAPGDSCGPCPPVMLGWPSEGRVWADEALRLRRERFIPGHAGQEQGQGRARGQGLLCPPAWIGCPYPQVPLGRSARGPSSPSCPLPEGPGAREDKGQGYGPMWGIRLEWTVTLMMAGGWAVLPRAVPSSSAAAGPRLPTPHTPRGPYPAREDRQLRVAGPQSFPRDHGQ